MSRVIVVIGRLSALGLLLLPWCGCGSAAPPMPETIPFSGKVTLDGKPLDFALIAFMPDGEAEESPYTVVGTTNAEGEYELVTRLGVREEPGAVPGHYKVVVHRFTAPLGPDRKPQSRPAIPKHYSDPQQTTLETTIPDEGGTQDFDLKRS